MQFREQGKRIQVLAYRGYDKTKKRAKIELLGSFGRYSFDMSDGLMNKLTVNEKNELLSHIETIRQSDEKSSRQSGVKYLASQINKVSDSLTSNEFASLANREYATEVYTAIDDLTKKLRKLGFRRPAKGTVKSDDASYGSGDQTAGKLL